MKRVKVFAMGFLVALFAICFITTTSFAGIRYLTETYPPFNMETEGVGVQGIAVDLLSAMLVNVGEERPVVELIPWTDGYKAIQEEKGICLFSTTRTAARESLFEWVGPIATIKFSAITHKERDLSVKTAEELINLKIGTIKDDATDQMAQELGATSFIYGADSDENIKNLIEGRIDTWVYGDLVAKWQIKELGYNPDDFEFQFVMSENPIFYAFSKGTDSEFLAKLQKSLDELVEQGVYDLLVTPYLH